ncbi:DUF4332 domain-containing protein [Desulfurobacterium atlanticum]|uniref:Helix-hairpin-helix DNA-binding motif class 1 domain-containing protein n=1 Tax=Desulfurobacterium atlanticum TaxID=240169 RepID=A0A238Z5K4_9BACT|nr:DUF4332 domain-containing protein [Desulfurobacterium atlanticum]SNR78258.1 protein of unknown function [Desulfurobacterium atlanticum]
MPKDIRQIEGIGKSYAEKLKSIGISTVEELLEKGATSKGREEIAEKIGISSKVVLKWVNKADLMRVRGIGEEYADLLEAAGVDTVPELSRRNPENLYEKIVEVNKEKKLVRQLPGVNKVAKWVEEAKKLPKKVTY